MLTYLSEPTQAQLDAITQACVQFREFWSSFEHMPFECNFAGAKDDVRALDYLDYEGLGYPSSGLKGAALIWGNVLASNLELVWKIGPNGELFLFHDEPGNRVSIWPFARVIEAQESSRPQFGRYGWLLERAVSHLMQFGDLSDQGTTWARGVLECGHQ